MILKQFCLVHCYPQGATPLSTALRNLRLRCSEISPEARGPKLGDHTTLLPPFRAHPDEMIDFCRGLNIARAYYGEGKGGDTYAETQGIDFFRNPGTDALVVKILLPPNYKAMIEACRKDLSRSHEWIFPVLGGAYLPHICVAEGPHLYEDLSRIVPELGKYIFIIRFHLSFPKIMVKVDDRGKTRWEEFDPSK